MLQTNWVRSASALALLLAAFGLARALDNSRWGASYFPDVELTTQDGQKVKFYSDLLKGKIVAIDLIYTHCVDACPLETARLVQVQHKLGDRMGKDIFFYSISIDPKRDTPEVLKAYAEKYHVGPGWLFLTGKQEDIELISRKLGLYSEANPNNRDGHTPSVLIGNQNTGQWMRGSATDNPSFLAMMIGRFMTGPGGSSAQPLRNYADATSLKLNTGQYLFATRCAACHTIGKGDKIGPDLLGVTNVRERAWLIRFIQEPDKVLEDGDPIAVALFKKYQEVRMPNLRLGDGDITALMGFLESQTSAAAVHQPPKDEAHQ